MSGLTILGTVLVFAGVVILLVVIFGLGWLSGVRYAVTHPRKVLEAMDTVALREDIKNFEKGRRPPPPRER